MCGWSRDYLASPAADANQFLSGDFINVRLLLLLFIRQLQALPPQNKKTRLYSSGLSDHIVTTSLVDMTRR